ncbi:hypothetical protein CSKR_110014 [Clonorchis sinensis]|uniref:Uncharacterized protein n=2 Tax=Clonorchis sinensis TaxID=79923 RepID=A0A3R7DKT8_CLOSI|nr:hypothetical protein CSKR_110014 [Clonorchis sinensis]
MGISSNECSRKASLEASKDNGDLLTILENDEAECLVPFVALPSERYDSDERIFKEDTMLDRRKKRNLLHIASILSATKCVKLLVNSPYFWDPDRLDASGWTPLQIAEDRDDLSTLYELAVHSRELRHFKPAIPTDGGRQFVSSCLVWPQDVLLDPFDMIEFYLPTLRGIGRGVTPYLTVRTSKTGLSGRSMALLFELLLANPYMSTVTALVGNVDQDPFSNNADCEASCLWPMQPIEVSYISDHDDQCQIYPDCLFRSWMLSLNYQDDFFQAFKELYNIWKFHRFAGSYSEENENIKAYLSPITLLSACRVAIRRHLVNKTFPSIPDSQSSIYPNYVRHVLQLGLPQLLTDFLLYREMWPETEWTEQSRWRDRRKRRPREVKLDPHGLGYVVDNGFIPNLRHPCNVLQSKYTGIQKYSGG